MSIAVINYGAGNLPNVVRALHHVGADLTVTDDPAVVLSAEAWCCRESERPPTRCVVSKRWALPPCCHRL